MGSVSLIARDHSKRFMCRLIIRTEEKKDSFNVLAYQGLVLLQKLVGKPHIMMMSVVLILRQMLRMYCNQKVNADSFWAVLGFGLVRITGVTFLIPS